MPFVILTRGLGMSGGYLKVTLKRFKKNNKKYLAESKEKGKKSRE